MNGGKNVVCNFEEIIENPIFIGCDTRSLDKETSANMWAISIGDTIIKHMSTDKLLKFTDSLLSKKKQQLSELNISGPVIFYMWFDEMAAQLRFNIISKSSEKLPFGCEVNNINSPNSIVQAFLKSQQNSEISWDELQEITDDSDEINDNPFVLDVFIVQMNHMK